jgi:hypothetical protein
MSTTFLKLEVEMLEKAREILHNSIKREPYRDKRLIIQDLHTLRGITKQIQEKEALLRFLSPLAGWERQLLDL